MITFTDALEAMASGNAVKRASWPKQDFVVLRGGSLEYLLRGVQYELTHTDVMSDDWHVCTITERSS